MDTNRNVVVAALVGVIAGILIGASTSQFSKVLAQGINPTYIKTVDDLRNYGDINRIFSLPQIQDRIEDQGPRFRSAAPPPSDCDVYSGQRYTRCKIAEQEGIEYQPSSSVKH
ncbi:MAG: hypothetical protein K9M03_03120 [Kiritimatiellales bacterium]|nr:hypothetical protein [Kiritimatiellales bacterium]